MVVAFHRGAGIWSTQGWLRVGRTGYEELSTHFSLHTFTIAGNQPSHPRLQEETHRSPVTASAVLNSVQAWQSMAKPARCFDTKVRVSFT